MAVLTYIDGVEITSIVQEGSVTHQLNQPAFATIRVPLDQVATSWDAAKLRVVVDGTLDFHGMIVHSDDQGDENTMSRAATFASPAFIFEYRPARDGSASGDPGDFTKPTFSTRNTSAPQMIQEILTQSIGPTGIPADAEGPMGIALGSFATGGVDLSFDPTDVPLTIADVIAFLVETGELDVVEKFIDSGGNMAEVSCYNGDYGTDRSSSVSFQYATGSYNCRGARRTRDYSRIMNKLWIYGGPREGNKDVPQDGQHWPYNVTGDDPGLTGFAGYSTVASEISASRAAYYVRMQVRIFDNDIDAREAHRRWWLMESHLRSRPQTLVHLTPQRGTAPAFGVGDLIHVEAGSRFGGGFSGTQRVMEYSYRWDVDGVIELGEPIGQALAGRPPVVTSSDAEL